jgi:hypothetical protein
MRVRVALLAIAVAAVALLGTGASAATVNFNPTAGLGLGSGYYDSIPNPLPLNLLSYGAQSAHMNEIGNEITLGPGPLLGVSALVPANEVAVTLASNACESGSGPSCASQRGATFQEPITLNIYNQPAPGGYTPGSLITSVTKTFSIPYRPSASPQCNGVEQNIYGQEFSATGWWYDGVQGCSPAILDNVTFPLGTVRLPKTLVYGISYNTTSYGPNPYGPGTACFSTPQGCPYDALNIAQSIDPANLTMGTDPNPGTIWWNDQNPNFYCDNGADGSNIFREDSPEPGDNCYSLASTLGTQAEGPWTPPWVVPAVAFYPALLSPFFVGLPSGFGGLPFGPGLP